MAESSSSALPSVPGDDGGEPTFATPDLEKVPANRFVAALADLDPGYFALVMATGIVSIGAHLLGHDVISIALLWLTAVEFVVLTIAYVARGILFPRRFWSNLLVPGKAVGFFTIVAGYNVLATALVPHGYWLVALVLASIAVVVWLLLTYGLFCLVVLAGHRPALRDINGVWLVWVVATQSVAVVGTELAPSLPWPWLQDAFGTASLLSWGVGVVLYLILVVIIFLRLFLLPTTPSELGPAYWILMGATAISVRAAAGLLGRTDGLPAIVVEETRGFIAGFSVVLFSFGSWFIPMLVLFGLWRHYVRRYPWSYEPKLWSVVFPLGMYAVASITLGRAIEFRFLEDLASVWVWVGVVAWAIVALLGVAAFVNFVRRGRTELSDSTAPR